jgi:putative membrane protein
VLLRLLLVWIVNAVALLAVSYLMPSVQVTSFGAALAAAAVLGLVNAFVRPILVILTLPVTLLTLGLFIFVLNGLLFLVANLLEGFTCPDSAAIQRRSCSAWCVVAALGVPVLR